VDLALGLDADSEALREIQVVAIQCIFRTHSTSGHAPAAEGAADPIWSNATEVGIGDELVWLSEVDPDVGGTKVSFPPQLTRERLNDLVAAPQARILGDSQHASSRVVVRS
jgi:hypothetical protein